MTCRIVFFILMFSLFSCKEETTEVESHQYGLSLSTLSWNPRNFPTGSRIQLSLSEDFADTVQGASGDLSDETMQVANLWDNSVDFVQFFKPNINIVPNLDYSNLESYWDAPANTQIGIYSSQYWFREIPSQAVAITQFYAVADSYNGQSYYRLLHADIIFNVRNHEFSMDPDDGHKYHYPTVLLHELGHLLGLDHNFNFSAGSIMIPSFHQGYSQTELSGVDGMNLKSKYQKFSSNGSRVNFAVSSTPSLRGKQVKRFVRYLMKDGNCELHDHSHHNHQNSSGQ